MYNISLAGYGCDDGPGIYTLFPAYPPSTVLPPHLCGADCGQLAKWGPISVLCVQPSLLTLLPFRRAKDVCIHTLIINGPLTISNPRVCLSCCVHIPSGSPGDPAPESRALGYGKVHALKNKPCQGSRRGGGQAIPFCAVEANPMAISRR
jgi:hypothetical protein